MTLKDNRYYLISQAIYNHLRYRAGSVSKSSDNRATFTFEVKLDGGKRVYNALVDTYDTCIHLSIKEDGGTRTVLKIFGFFK